MDDTLGHGHVDALDGGADVVVALIGTDRGVGGLDARPQLGLHGLVALVALQVRDVALLLALDVGHGDRDLVPLRRQMS